MGRVEVTLWGLVLCLHHVESGAQSQIKRHHLLSRFTVPK